MDKYHLSNSERQIMEKLWSQSEPVLQTALLKQFLNDGKKWKRQCLNSFLIRLEGKGFIARKDRKVRALYTREQFGTKIVYDVLENYYDGDLNRLLQTLTEETVSKEKGEADFKGI